MSRSTWSQQWGPSHQQPPSRGGVHPLVKLAGWLFVAFCVHGTVDPSGSGVFMWCVRMVFYGWLVRLLIRGVRDGRVPIGWMGVLAGWVWRAAARPALSGTAGRLVSGGRVGLAAGRLGGRLRELRATGRPTAADLRERCLRCGGGAYLGVERDGRWVTADRESAVMVLGPPRSGKTSAVIIPALLAAPGAAISASTKPDVMAATARARGELGQVWLFDPAGEREQAGEGVRLLRWSPVAGAAGWDQALLTARAMTAAARPGAGTTNESHWSERAAALLAPMLYAAYLTGRPIEDVLRWTLRQELEPAREALEDHDAGIASDVLAGIEKTEARERSSIYSAAAGVLTAYNADASREAAGETNFDPARFAASRDTVYITAPEHMQALCAPLIVGLLEQIRHAVYRQAHGGPSEAPMLWALDEVANTAPIHDLPALVSQAGGQGLQVMVGLQDLSQARARWGQAAADGLMSLFQTRLVLSGIADSRTLEAISLSLGEYDRRMVSASSGTSERDRWLSPYSHSKSLTMQTHRQRVLSPGEVGCLPAGEGLLLRGGRWELIGLTPWFCSKPWMALAR